jgi:hypothetical protein
MEPMVEMVASVAVEHPVLCVALVAQAVAVDTLVVGRALILVRMAVAVVVVATTQLQQH